MSSEKTANGTWSQLPLRTLGLSAGIGSVTVILMALLPSSLISGSMVFVAVVGICFSIGLIACFSRMRFHQNLTFVLGIYCWWFILISEQLFVRKGTSESSLAGSFSGAAYGEVFVWILLFLVILGVLAKQRLRTSLLTGQTKWLVLFAILALLSSAYSPAPVFAAAWAFKLLVVVMILIACDKGLNQTKNQWMFWKSLFWAYVILVFAPLASTLTHPATIFGWRGFTGDQPVEFRLNTNIHPVDLSQHAALLVIVALTLNALDRRRSRMVVAVLAAAVMLLAVGKAAIVSCLACTLLLFVLQKRIRAGAGWLLLLAAAATAVFFFTPISSYFQDYGEHERVDSLTGRTELWELAAPSIREHPIWGHGFMSSKFISESVDLDWDAGQMHNAFLEVLYNNGCLGLLLILAVNGCILRNMWRVHRASDDPQLRTLASGCFALYCFLLLNGFVEPTFGGRPSCVFLVFQGLLVLSQALSRSAVPAPRKVPATVIHCSPLEARV